MISDETLRGLVSQRDIYVREGHGYRPVTMNDRHRRMYARLHDGKYRLLPFSEDGVDDRATPRPGPGAKAMSCGCTALLWLLGLQVFGMLVTLLLGGEGGQGIVPAWLGFIILTVIVGLVVRGIAGAARGRG